LIGTLLKRLDEDDVSPLHHGFLLQMNNLMKTTIYWDATLYEDIILSKQFPPTNEDLELLIIPLYTASELEKRKSENGKYKPIRDGCIPTLQDWKRCSREGKMYASNNRSTSYLDSHVREANRFHTASYHSNESHAITPTQSSHTTMILKEGKVGILEFFAGNDSRNIHYDENLSPEKSESNGVINLNVTLQKIISLVSLPRGDCDKYVEERIFTVQGHEYERPFIIYKLNELNILLLGLLLQIMNLKKDEILQIIGGKRKSINDAGPCTNLFA